MRNMRNIDEKHVHGPKKARYLNLSLIIATLNPGFVTCAFFPGFSEHGISILISPLHIYLFAIYYAILFTYAFFLFIIIILLVLLVILKYLLGDAWKQSKLLFYGVWVYYLISLYISTAYVLINQNRACCS